MIVFMSFSMVKSRVRAMVFVYLGVDGILWNGCKI